MSGSWSGGSVPGPDWPFPPAVTGVGTDPDPSCNERSGRDLGRNGSAGQPEFKVGKGNGQSGGSPRRALGGPFEPRDDLGDLPQGA